MMSDQLKQTNGKKSTYNFLNITDENFLSEALKTYGKYIASGLLGLLLLVILFYRFSGSHNQAQEQDYQKASDAFSTFVKSPESTTPASEKAFKELENLLKTYPELKPAYDGIIAQTLLNRSETNKALPFAEETIKRVEINHLSKYNQFASNTLLISEQKYQEALDNSLKLQEEMGKEINEISEVSQRQFGEELFAINLFRIAILQDHVGDRDAELKSWNLWKAYAGLGNKETLSLIKINRDVFRSVMQQLTIGNISLSDYMTYRENI